MYDSISWLMLPVEPAGRLAGRGEGIGQQGGPDFASTDRSWCSVSVQAGLSQQDPGTVCHARTLVSRGRASDIARASEKTGRHQLLVTVGVILLKDDDLTLVGECLKGNTEAFEVLVDRYQKPLFDVAFRITGDYENARDITQSAFVKVYERLGEYNPKHKFFSWIYRMVVNESLNAVARRPDQVPLDPGLASTDASPEQRAALSEMKERLNRGVLALPLPYRIVIVLRYFSRLSYREIGQVLRIPEKKVKSRLYTARQLLHEHLTRQGTLSCEG